MVIFAICQIFFDPKNKILNHDGFVYAVVGSGLNVKREMTGFFWGYIDAHSE
jgi:hypothetical protein